MLDVAGMDGGVVGVEAQARVAHLDDQLDRAVVLARGELQESVFVAGSLGQDLIERGHGLMLA